jgi:hypothetical protein
VEADEGLVLALRLCKEGFGTLNEIMEWPVDRFLDAVEYANFLADYQETTFELNRPTK